jgi:hypothetical protein
MVQAPEFAAWLMGATATFTTALAGLAFETIPFLLMGTRSRPSPRPFPFLKGHAGEDPEKGYRREAQDRR